MRQFCNPTVYCEAGSAVVGYALSAIGLWLWTVPHGRVLGTIACVCGMPIFPLVTWLLK